MYRLCCAMRFRFVDARIMRRSQSWRVWDVMGSLMIHLETKCASAVTKLDELVINQWGDLPVLRCCIDTKRFLRRPHSKRFFQKFITRRLGRCSVNISVAPSLSKPLQSQTRCEVINFSSKCLKLFALCYQSSRLQLNACLRQDFE